LCYQWIIHACSETDLRKIDFCKFSSVFLFFSVKRPDGISWRPDGWIFVVRTIFSSGVRTGGA